MTTIAHRIAAALIGITLVLGGIVATAPAADASPWCTIGLGCGQVKNQAAKHKKWMRISNSWDKEKKVGAGRIVKLRSGETSTRYFKDTDGVQIPPGYIGKRYITNGKGGKKAITMKPGWHKIRDYERWTILLVKK